MKQAATSMMMASVLSIMSTGTHAALPTNAVLTFDLGVCASGSCSSGSFFGMEVSPGFVIDTAIESFNGIVLGTAQPADGTHSGAPDGSESPDIDNPWLFFGNTGLHQSTSVVTVLTDDGAGNATLDFSGWNVTWNAIASIPMGAGSWLGNPEGVAIMTCSNTCESGDTFAIDYSATVPPGDPSGFGNVPYSLRLEGSVTVSGTPPVTGADSGQTIIGNPVILDVLANDSSPDGLDAASVTVVALPSNGAAVPNADGTVTYTPNTAPDFTGADAFAYTVDSNLGVTSASTAVDVDVQTNVAPVANDDSVTISDTALNNNPLVISVLANDTDSNNSADLPGGIDSGTVTIVSNATTGACVANTDGTITYSQTAPSVGGQFSCTYKVSDVDAVNAPLESNVATVNIGVTATASDWPAALDPGIIPVLFFEPGIAGDPGDQSVPALGGTYFTMQVTPQTLIYTVMQPASSGGLIIGHDQPAGNSHTGSPTGDEETSVDLGWNFFANTGFSFTANGGVTGNPDGTLQFGSLTGGQGKYIITWNGIPEIDLGGAPAAFPDDLGFGTIVCTPAPCADQSTFELDYAAHVPPGDPSGFGGVPYTLRMVGTVGFLDGALKTSNGNIADETRLLSGEVAATDPDSEVDLQCVGDCFDFTIDGVTESRVSVVLPLAGGVPLNPVWRIFDNGAWRSFDTSAGDSIKSAPFVAGSSECPDPGDAAYGDLTTGDFCLELSIADNGLNDLDPTLGIIADPSGMGSGGTAGGGSEFVDTRGSNTRGCAIMAGSANPLHRSDWWLLIGLVALLGWYRGRQSARR